ncbi:MAG: hypothetical protein A2X55_04770 [Nitrospirae bacterium GWB2_47_37]|nr:MAG: hypothetical protein A2X55_04770 [Nitrospirae bacterium GWB2_47_37]HAK89645.1 hypothetical protein [Nitrospiraceae bacterium]
MSKGPHSDLKIIFWFLRPYRLVVFLIFLFLLIYALMEAASIGAFYPMLNTILPGDNSVPAAGGRILSFLSFAAGVFPITDKLIATSVFLLMLVLVSNAFGFVAEGFASWYRYKLHADFLNQVYRKLLHNHYVFYLEKKQGDLLYIGMNASQAVGEMLLYFPKVGIEFFRIFVISVLLLSISVKMTLIIFVLMAFFGCLIHYLSTKVIHPVVADLQDVQSDITSVFSESVSGIKQLKIYDSLGFWYDRFKQSSEKSRLLLTKSAIFQSMPTRLVWTVGLSSIVLSILYVKIYFPSRLVSILPVIAVYVLSLQRLMPSVSNIGHYWMGLKSLAPRLDVTYRTLTDKEYLMSDGGMEFNGLREGIRLENISFSYPTKEAVLRDVKIFIPANRTTAIVGESGSGKSTLTDLIVRLYEPESGKILADHIDYSEFSLASWIGRIGMVTQEPFIFHASIKDNIKIGKLQATDEEIIEAAKMAHAHQFIMELPQGYDTVVGDRGIKLSGGQRQRVAIARAIIKKPEILILDEATSSLDNISEKIVQEALDEAILHRTTIIVAHRLSTIEHADRIIVMKQGEVVEQGTHEELIKSGGYYMSLYQKQREPSKEEVIIDAK